METYTITHDELVMLLRQEARARALERELRERGETTWRPVERFLRQMGCWDESNDSLTYNLQIYAEANLQKYEVK